MIVYPAIPQGTPQWRALRRGRPTASHLSEVITAAKGDYSASAPKYMAELLAQCFETDVDPDRDEFSTFWTRRGQELEPLARSELATILGREAHQVGFCIQENGIFGCSPDVLFKTGDAYDDGGELKCPAPAQHVKWVMDGGLPLEHKAQVHGSMVITSIPRWNFLSYCPGMQPFHVQVTWDDFTDKLAALMARFTSDYKALHERLIPKLQLTLPSPQPTQDPTP